MPNRDIPHMILEIPHWIADFALHNFLPRTKLFSGSMVVDTQKKHRQSPIDIKSELVCCDPEQCKVDSLTIDYKERDCVSVTCSDGGWKVNVADNCTSTLTGSHLKDKYLLAQFHAHWSKDGSCGSEHTIDGKPTAAEVHFVFWNTKYANICEALEKEDGLAVVGVFIKEGKHNKAYQPLLEAIGDANKAPGKTASLPTNLSLQDLLPKPGICFVKDSYNPICVLSLHKVGNKRLRNSANSKIYQVEYGHDKGLRDNYLEFASTHSYVNNPH